MKIQIRETNNDQHLSEFSSECIAVYQNGRIVDCNSNFTAAFGYEENEVPGLSLFHFFPKIYRELIKAAESPGPDRIVETVCVKKDSATFPAGVIIKSVKKNEGVVNAVCIRDETERKKLENELLKSTFFQRAILNSSNLAIISTDFRGWIKTFNRGAEKMFGLKAEEVVDKKYLADLHRKEAIQRRAKELSDKLNKTIAPDFSVFVGKLHVDAVDEHEWTYDRKDGSTFMALVSATPLKDNLDEITGYLFTATDITEKKKAEAEIIEKSQLLNGILSNMPVFVFKVDQEGNFIQSMGSGLDALGLKKYQLTGRNIHEIFSEHKAALQKACHGESVSFIHSSLAGLHYEYYVFPDRGRKGGLVGFALDISSKMAAENQLKNSADELARMNKELNQFAYIVSHDLKAPLRSIANLAVWIEEDLGDDLDEEVKSNLDLLANRVQRMQNLIDGILSYSRAGRIKSEDEDVDLLELVRETVQVIDPPKGFRIVVSENLPTIWTNKTWMEQIFANLIGNAVKYHHKETGNINVDYDRVDSYHQFTVADDGPGIAPESHDRVFLIFQTLQSKDVKDSTGIGLTIVKKIIEEQGGTIRIESDGKSGTKFVFTLPHLNREN